MISRRVDRYEIKGAEAKIKLLASPARLESLRSHALLSGDERIAQVSTTYFDTPDNRLQSAGASLRLRFSGSHREQTFKCSPTGSSCIERTEWTVPATGDRPDLMLFSASQRGVIAALLAGGEFSAVATTSVERRTRLVRHGRSLVEAAFDVGLIEASGRTETISELELELGEGDAVDCLRLALALRPGPDLRWSIEAKTQRCLALATGHPPQTARARPVAVSRDQDIPAAFQEICWSCLEQVLGNYALVAERHDNEAVHQCRVAFRRLRAALALFGKVIDRVGATDFRARFRQAADALGPARDLHVLLERISAHDAPAGSCESPIGTRLASELTRRRDAEVIAAGTRLRGEDFQSLLFDLAIWVESRRAASDMVGQAAPDRLPVFAASLLKRCRHKLHHTGRHLRAMSDHDLHRLRLTVKKLRYSVGFFAALAATPEDRLSAMKHEKLLGKLQDTLGALHDLATASAGPPWLSDCEPELIAELARRLASANRSRHRLLHRAQRRLEHERKIPHWWNPAARETDVPHSDAGLASYADQLRQMQIGLSCMQRQAIADQRKLLIIVEGRDAADKDGTIKRIVEHMSPRATRVVALGLPSEDDRKTWYFERWCRHLPVAGEVVLFNRGWYDRAGVEHVMGLCTEDEYEEFMTTAVLFEQLLAHSGFTILKYYLDISKDEQKRRLRDRDHDPLEQWTNSPLDRRASGNWEKYSKARNAMLARTHSVFAPWVVVRADDKPAARLGVIRDLLARCGTRDENEEVMPAPSVTFVYDPVALDKGWLAE
ncbi:CHAD domain-containing protein [Acetobacter peroxydans]|jgi:polyphosphate kinase 2|uniref:CHAD domain-containing protein n=1 Tax=Acetobacter peroxydans TaxID=104098 RepID=UPI002354238F|nr:CHAD domain-containing protein [Acetobacter peroxydans]MCH4143534.1 CHAD domain-containing protein [Acetobacter peroxydans]MCI1394510.1 CHAD domain-containing protein [Acetobacter peroxydans]MCI1411410.1 CHAD domain-containing protein [Acetobacter peroxydans]MCI1439541.1 CHAD domain-containing protein [Acetobacter peroxydans]MCI1566507.1 CHAD domain-containing protein [Acetobacter peroxydans]